jgi:hypothetical protein
MKPYEKPPDQKSRSKALENNAALREWKLVKRTFSRRLIGVPIGGVCLFVFCVQVLPFSVNGFPVAGVFFGLSWIPFCVYQSVKANQTLRCLNCDRRILLRENSVLDTLIWPPFRFPEKCCYCNFPDKDHLTKNEAAALPVRRNPYDRIT